MVVIWQQPKQVLSGGFKIVVGNKYTEYNWEHVIGMPICSNEVGKQITNYMLGGGFNFLKLSSLPGEMMECD